MIDRLALEKGTLARFLARAAIVVALGVGGAGALLWLLSGRPLAGAWTGWVHAAGWAAPLQAPGDVYCVTPLGSSYPGCTQVFTNVQAAVDAAAGGEVIKVASGVYTGVNHYGGLAQVVYITKSLSIYGGYTVTNWVSPDLSTNTTLLDAQGQGRGMVLSGPISVTLGGLHVANGWTDDAGGGIEVASATVRFSHLHISGNHAANGGGIHLLDSVAELFENTVVSNTANAYGCGLLIEGESDVALTQNRVSYNTSNTPVSNQGGGLMLATRKATLISNTFSHNMNNGGGGLALNGTADALVTGNTVLSNTAREGAGLYVSASNVTLSANVFRGNSATGGSGLGGAMWVSGIGHPVTVTGNLISGNTAESGGGGIYVYHSGATLERNVIVGNSAHLGGGVLVDTDATARATNNVICDNEAVAGAGMWIQSATPHLLHNTIARNRGNDGSGIYVAGSQGWSTVFLTDTIVVSHTVGITVAAGHTVRMEATLWGTGTWANETDWGGAGQILTGTHNVWGDPAFVDPGAGDYHIGSRSAARDAGLDAGVDEDLDGEPRPEGGGYDIGADEFSGPSLMLLKRAGAGTVPPGSALTYTLWVTNDGTLDLHATVTDTLPTRITDGATPGGTPISPGGTLTWTPTVARGGGVWTTTVAVTVEAGYTGLLTNTVEATTLEGATGIYTEGVAVIGPNGPPYAPADPAPVDGAIGVPLTQTLSWQGGDPDGDPLTYTVSFGTGDPPPVVATTTLTSYTPALSLDTTYYWSVAASDGLSTMARPVWTFAVVAPERVYLPVVLSRSP